jgi:hypothetical protein
LKENVSQGFFSGGRFLWRESEFSAKYGLGCSRRQRDFAEPKEIARSITGITVRSLDLEILVRTINTLPHQACHRLAEMTGSHPPAPWYINQEAFNATIENASNPNCRPPPPVNECTPKPQSAVIGDALNLQNTCGIWAPNEQAVANTGWITHTNQPRPPPYGGIALRPGFVPIKEGAPTLDRATAFQQSLQAHAQEAQAQYLMAGTYSLM